MKLLVKNSGIGRNGDTIREWATISVVDMVEYEITVFRDYECEYSLGEVYVPFLENGVEHVSDVHVYGSTLSIGHYTINLDLTLNGLRPSVAYSKMLQEIEDDVPEESEF